MGILFVTAVPVVSNVAYRKGKAACLKIFGVVQNFQNNIGKAQCYTAPQ